MAPHYAAFTEELDRLLAGLIKDGCPPVEKVAALMNKSRVAFHNWVVAATGYTPANYFHRFRMKRANELLHDCPHPDQIVRVAQQVGYHPKKKKAFVRAYKRQFHCTPRQLICILQDKQRQLAMLKLPFPD